MDQFEPGGALDTCRLRRPKTALGFANRDEAKPGVFAQEASHRGRIQSGEVAKRPSNGLDDEELGAVRVRGAEFEDERHVSVASPAPLMLNCGTIEPKIL